MKCFIVISNNLGEMSMYEIDSDKPIADELIRVMQQEKIVLYENDCISFVYR
jgi:hypothetical protein